MLIGGLNGNGESGPNHRRRGGGFGGECARSPPVSPVGDSFGESHKSPLVFPPTGVAYRENAESHVLWRWIALQAPDLVLIVGGGDPGLAQALSTNAVAGVGRIPARVIITARPTTLLSLPRDIPLSEAHAEINRRRARSPRQLAEELGQYFGHDFNQLTTFLEWR